MSIASSSSDNSSSVSNNSSESSKSSSIYEFSNSSFSRTVSSCNEDLSLSKLKSIPSSIFSFNSNSLLSSEYSFTSSPKLCNSFIKTLKLSGTPGSGIFSPLTIASYVFTLPTTSSDFTVNISCNVCAAPYASSAQTYISPKRCPPNCAFPPRGCCVTNEYGPVERACILSSNKWCSFNMYITPTVTG